MRWIHSAVVAVLLITLLIPFGSADNETPRDLDVGVPIGTPLEWDKEHRQPVPTGGRGAVPTTDKVEDPKDPGKKDPKGMTVSEERTPPAPQFTYGITSLYDYFRVTTQDIMDHVSINVPKSTGKVNEDDYDDVATGGGGKGKSTMVWNYPPEVPMELVWMACMACLREQCHPELISIPESTAYCIELGVPGLYGAKAGGGMIGGKVQKAVKPMPTARPSVPKGRTNLEMMLCRLAMVELTSGYAYALDPTFARRTLGLGEEAFYPVLQCAKSKHPFLAQNAVAVLANYRSAEAGVELKKMFEKSRDPVVQYRALSGLLRRKDTTIVKTLSRLAKGGDETMQVYALYALGQLGDPKGAKSCRAGLARGIKHKDLLWSALPALGRIADRSKQTLAALKATEAALRQEIGGKNDKVETKTEQGATGPITVEAAGTKYRVLRQMAVLALAANGESLFHEEVIKRFEKNKHEGFHKSVYFLLVDCLMKMGDEGQKKVKEIIDGSAPDVLKVHALRVYAGEGKADKDYLKGLTSSGPSALRALAIQMLADKDEDMAREVCVGIVSSYGSGSGTVDGGEAFVVATACNVGAKIKARWGAAIIDATKRAFAAKAWGKREGVNEKDIRKCSISVYPSLLETLTVEVGRPGLPEGVDVLISILTGGQKQARGEACLGLGALGGPKATDALMKALEDPDGWVRFLAYRGLYRISGQDHFTDWIFGAKSQRDKMTEKYKEWYNTKK